MRHHWVVGHLRWRTLFTIFEDIPGRKVQVVGSQMRQMIAIRVELQRDGLNGGIAPAMSIDAACRQHSVEVSLYVRLGPPGD